MRSYFLINVFDQCLLEKLTMQNIKSLKSFMSWNSREDNIWRRRQCKVYNDGGLQWSFFVFLKFFFFCFVVAIFDQVHDVQAIFTILNC